MRKLGRGTRLGSGLAVLIAGAVVALVAAALVWPAALRSAAPAAVAQQPGRQAAETPPAGPAGPASTVGEDASEDASEDATPTPAAEDGADPTSGSGATDSGMASPEDASNPEPPPPSPASDPSTPAPMPETDEPAVATESPATSEPALSAPRPAARAAQPTRFDEVSFVKTPRPVVALTFDAGAAVGATDQTLEVLRARGIRATFFITGQFAESYPKTVRQIAEDGHEISNHSYSHRDFTELSDWEIERELAQTEEIMLGLTGMSTKPLMRMPFGARNARVLQTVAAAGYRPIHWNLDSADWREGATAPGVTSRVLGNTEPGDIVVFHCATQATARGLPAILDGLSARGISVVTVSDLLQDE